MKIALCLSGEPREYLYSYLFYSKLINKYKIDVFIHTWNIQNCETFNEVYKKYTFNNNLIFKLNTLYKPIKFLIENKEDMKYNNYYEFMFYSIYKCNELKKEYEDFNNFKYDLVIRSRFDIIFDDNLLCLDKNIFYVDWIKYNNNIIGDNLAISNSFNIDVYSNIHNYIYNIFNILNLSNNTSLLTHRLLYYYLNNMNIYSIKVINCYLLRKKNICL